MFLGAGEIVVVLAVALMVLGPKKMPEVARKLARFLAQLRRVADEVRTQVDDALNEPPTPPPADAKRMAQNTPDLQGPPGISPSAPPTPEPGAQDETGKPS